MFSLRSIAISTSHHTLDAIPNHQVDHVGVRYLGWILARAFGAARCAAIESTVRAVGRMVVCVEAMAEDRIASIITLLHVPPSIPVSTSSGLSFRNLGPLNAVAAKATITYVPTRMRVESTVAVPAEVRPWVSSLTLAAVSQPQ